jgi:SAM-dependent methyltransferase
MYTENPAKDAILFAKALMSNQLARFAPDLYMSLTRQTGRGEGEEDVTQIAEYFTRCFNDYRDQVGLNGDEFKSFLKGRVVLEYGPGDILGVALLFYAHGAERVCCVDRFPLSKLSTKNIDAYQYLLDSLTGRERERADNAFKESGNPASGFNQSAIDYRVARNGLSGSEKEYDMIISRAVLEHVNNLEETMLDVKRGMKPGGVSIHQVDLKSHGLDRYTAFDFLTWPEIAYRLMYSHKGFPNRWRVDKYKELAASSHLRVRHLSPTGLLDREKIEIVHPKLAKSLRHVTPEDLAWTGFWMVLEHPAASG